MTRQEIFDTVAKHLLTQGQRSTNPGSDSYGMYRTDTGLRCAVGCLIKDEHYSPELEGETVLHGKVRAALEASGIPTDAPATNLVYALQYVHDRRDVARWKMFLYNVAFMNGLSTSVLETP